VWVDRWSFIMYLPRGNAVFHNLLLVIMRFRLI
jgi:hypothetical protein